MKTGVLLLMTILSILGITDASYLTWEKLTGYIPRCTTFFKCGTVLSSQWSSIGTIPVSGLGIVFYVVLLLLVILLYTGHHYFWFLNTYISIYYLTWIWGLVGVMFSLYLVFIMGFVIQAWCMYCLASAMNTMLLFGLNSVVLWLHRSEKAL